MRLLMVSTLTALLLLPSTLAQTAPVQAGPVPCALAEKIDLAAFTLLGRYDDNEVGSDAASSDYAECQARALTRDLRGMPQLSARLSTLRKLYRQLNAAEGALAFQLAGGGTLYVHGVSRSYPAIETTLRTLSALAGSRYGAATGQQFAASISGSRQALAARLSLLRGHQPDKGDPFDPARYKEALGHYEAAASAIQKLLGNQNNAATAAGFIPLGGSLFLDDLLNNND